MFKYLGRILRKGTKGELAKTRKPGEMLCKINTPDLALNGELFHPR